MFNVMRVSIVDRNLNFFNSCAMSYQPNEK